MAYHVFHANTRVTPLAEFPLAARVLVAVYSLAFYVSRTAMPLGLIPLYELPADVDPTAIPFLASGLAVIAGAMVAVIGRRVAPAAHGSPRITSSRWPWSSGSCIPATSSSTTATATSSRLGVLIGAAVSALVAGGAGTALRPVFRHGALAAVGAWFFAMVSLTPAQAQVWRDDQTLWRSAVDVDPECSLCHGNLGAALHPARQLGPDLWHVTAG